MSHRTYLICLIAIFSTGPALAQVSSATSSATTLQCRFSGKTGTMHFKNSGTRPDFKCEAYCEWVTTGGKVRFTGDLKGIDVEKGEDKTRWSKEYHRTIIRSEKARLKCN